MYLFCFISYSFLLHLKKGMLKIKLNLKDILSQPRFSIPLKILITIAVAASILLNLFTHVIPIVKYYGDGMLPSLEAGQILLLTKTQNVDRGDVIAFYYNNKILVRRVIGVGGDKISLDRSGALTLNGDAVEEPYVEKAAYGQVTVEFPYNVPASHFFVMGDNRASSIDSRLIEIGAISEDRIIGRVLFSILPPKRVN